MGRIDRTGVDIRRLRYFAAVCTHGGFSSAARVVGIAQPALTRQIQLLEQELGVQLFMRNGRSATPTEAGQVLLAEAREHLEGLDQVVHRLRRDYAGDPQRVSLGVCPTIAPLFLDAVQDMLRQVPGVPVLSVIEAYSGDLRNLMAAGRLDLALSYSPPDPSEVRATPLLSEKLVVATRFPRLGAVVGLDEIARLKLILPSRMHQLRQIIDAVCAGRDCLLRPALELDSLAAVKAMLAEDRGDFATILPYHSVAQDAAAGRYNLVPIDDPQMVRTIALLQPAAGVAPLPAVLVEAIGQRAADIRRTMEAVF
jgi:LysR family nitrogen assimilation transcriptional regulator